MADTFLSNKELQRIGFKVLGNNVFVSKNACIHSAGSIELGNNVRIDDFCFISGNIKIENYVHLTAGVFLYGSKAGIVFQDYTTAAPRTIIHADSDDYSGEYMTNPMVPTEFTNPIHESVLIKKHTIIGSSCVILPGVTLEEGSAIGAMSLVTKSTNPWTINFGVPSKEVKPRKKDLLKFEKELEMAIKLCGS